MPVGPVDRPTLKVALFKSSDGVKINIIIFAKCRMKNASDSRVVKDTDTQKDTIARHTNI